MHIYGFAKVGKVWTVTRLERINGTMHPVAEVASHRRMEDARDDCAARNLVIDAALRAGK